MVYFTFEIEFADGTRTKIYYLNEFKNLLNYDSIKHLTISAQRSKIGHELRKGHNDDIDFELPTLPKNLTFLSCDTLGLKKLPKLPETLEHLYCAYNHITELPDLPQSLAFLSIYDNPISEYPKLPYSLEYYFCSYTNITCIDELPNSITELYCSDIPNLTIKNLPNKLKKLVCCDCNLKDLPKLPDSLLELFCNNNNLKSLPDLPLKLRLLLCYGNKLTKLPIIHESLKNLNCANNNLRSMPHNIDMFETHPYELNFRNNPIYDEIYSLSPIQIYANKRKLELADTANKIGQWYLDCKYNPKYKKCREKLEQEYEELYNQ